MHATRYTMTDRPRYLSVCPSYNLLFSHISLEYHSETFLVTQTGRVGRGGGGEGGERKKQAVSNFICSLAIFDSFCPKILQQQHPPWEERAHTHTTKEKKKVCLPLQTFDFCFLYSIPALFLIFSALICLPRFFSSILL